MRSAGAGEALDEGERTGPPADLADLAPTVLAHLREHRARMTDLLRELAEMETPSRSPATQGAILERIGGLLRDLGFRTRRLPGRSTGGHLFARAGRRGRGGDAQLLLGHCDTVWPPGTLATMPVEVEGDVIRGPGVFDMKGGLVQMIFALSALRQLDLRPEVEPAVLVTSDEEIGSPESVRWVRLLARRVRRAWVLEPALGPGGALKTARKGTGSFEIRVVGRGAHVGLAPEEGASAIQELSHVVQHLHGLSDRERGLTVNVGEIEGGVRPNVVAPEARAVVDVRVPTLEAGGEVEEAIRSMEAATPGTRLVVTGGINRPPMERTPGTRHLWEAAEALGRAMGLELREGTAGGASDGNFTARFTPTLDGLGAVGDGAHADHEHARLDRMPERSALLALLLLLPAGTASGAAGRREGGGP